MDWREIISAYDEKFEVANTGIPWDGFPDEETEKEYFRTLQKCVEIGKPLTLEQRKHFFPLEFQDLPPGTLY